MAEAAALRAAQERTGRQTKARASGGPWRRPHGQGGDHAQAASSSVNGGEKLFSIKGRGGIRI